MKLVDLVITEAKNLIKFATEREINKLRLEYFDPNSVRNCIYGQMTGDCQSERAKELIQICTNTFYKNAMNDDLDEELTDVYLVHYWSPIEVYVRHHKPETLISFLKKEIDEKEFIRLIRQNR